MNEKLLIFFVFIVALGLLVGCDPHTSDGTIPDETVIAEEDIQIESKKILTGETIAIEIEQEEEITYEWSAQKGTIQGEGTSILYTAPNSAGIDTITIIATSTNNQQTTLTFDITIEEPSNEENQRPIISEFIAEPTTIQVNENSTLTVQAIDPNDSSLTYEWLTNHGTIEGEGDTVTYVAPNEAGYYPINVNVKNDEGTTTSATVNINVVDESDIINQPTINTLTSDKEKVDPNETATFTIDATDPNGDLLSYDWKAEHGSLISESDGTAIYTAPSYTAYDKVTVTVYTSSGEEASESIHITVGDNKVSNILTDSTTPIRAIATDDNYIYTASEANVIYVYNKIDFSLEEEILIPNNYIRTMHSDGDNLYVSMLDSTIYVYSTTGFNLSDTITEVTEGAFNIVSDENNLYLGDADGKAYIIEKTNHSIVETITGAQTNLISIQIDDNYIYAGDTVGIIYIMNKDDFSVETSLSIANTEDQNIRLRDLEIDDNYIYALSNEDDTNIVTIYDKSDFSKKININDNSNPLYGLLAVGNNSNLYFGINNDDDLTYTITTWDKASALDSSKNIIEEYTANNEILAVEVDDTYLYASDYDGTVFVWEQ
ncbi:MAG: PKD domain-containing protein [bacterium]